MGKFLNPFRTLNGVKTLIWGLMFIVASALILWAGGAVQDGYLHYTYLDLTWWQVGVMELLWWLLPTVILYLIGLVWRHSKVSIVNLLGTTAFSHLAMIPSIALLAIPYFKELSVGILEAVKSGVLPSIADLCAMSVMGIVSLACLVLFYIWNYKAFATSCNVRGGWVITVYVLVQLIITILGGYISQPMLSAFCH